MNLQTPIRDRARGLRGPGLTSEQEAQVEEAIAAGEAIPNIRPTSGEQLPFTSALNGANGGAVAIVEGGRVVGFTIPAGQTGAGSFTLPRTFFTKEEAQRLKGCTIRFPVVMEASVGFRAATPFGGNAVRADRDTGFIDLNEGSALAAEQAEGSTVLTRDYLYVMQGDEIWVGPTLQIAPNAPTSAVRYFKVTSCVYEVVATPASTATTGADAVLDNRFAATAPKVDVFRSIEPALKMNGGAQVLLDAAGRDMGATVEIGATGAGTILQWKLPLTGALREAMQGGQPELELVFETSPGWDRAHAINMQAGKFDLTWVDFLTANRRDYQTIDLATGQRTKRVMGFSFLAPDDLSEFSDLRAYIALTDATPATVAERIRLTGYSIKMFRTRGNGELPVPRTLMLAGEVSRASAVEQALATVYGTGKRVGAQLPVSDYGSIAEALKAATALAGPGAIAMVELDEGTYFEHSLGKITNGTDGVLPGQDGAFIGLRGKGMGRTRIDGSLPANTPIDEIRATSTIDFNANQYLEGVTLIAEGERYGGHVDNANYKKNTCLIWRHVEVEHRGNDAADAYHGTTVWPSQHPIAIGTTSGSFYGYYECRLKGRRAAFSAHDQRNFEQPSTVEWVGGPLTAVDTTGWSYRLESIGSMVMNRALLAHASLGGEISMAAQPWLPDEPENQPADHRCWELTGYGNSPAAFRIQDFGRALRITSATTGPGSKVAVSNAATPILFGKTGTEGVTQVDGDVGLSGYAYGYIDISDASTKADITALKAKLGNRTASPITLTVHVDALAPIDIVLNKNYLAMTNAEIIADMNAALGGVAIVSEYAVGERYRPFFSDEERQLKNSSGTTILMGMALAVDSDGAGTVRPMTATDLPTAFAGVAWEDIRPGAHGRVKTDGWLPTADLLRSDGGSPNLGTTFAIDPAKPGYVLSNNVSGSGILPVVRGSLGAGLWTVAVRTQIDGQDVVDQAADLVQAAYDTIGALGDPDNIEAIGRIPSEGANVIPIDGNGLSLSPSAILTGAQAVLPIHFRSSNIYRTKRALIAAHIAGDSLIDDGPRLTSAIFDALRKGRDLIVTEPIWCNTGAVVTAEGTLLKIIGMGEGSIIGGPGVVGPIVKASNIADVGETFARSIDAIVNNIKFDARFVPGGNLTSADCLNLNGFRLTHIDQCDLYAADHFYGSTKGDAGVGIRGARVVVSRSNFYGFLDAGCYLTANPDGTLDNTSALFLGNNYYGCRGGWAAKRAFEYIRSVGEYFDNCFNSFSTAPASSSNPVTGFTNAARKVSVKGAQIDNPISSAIDLRRAYDSHVDAVISGTIGRYPDGTSPAEVNIVKLLGTSRSRIDFVIDNEDPSIVATTTAVRIERTVNEDTGQDEGATDNVIFGTVRRVNTGLIEGELCDRNEISLKMIEVPNQGTTTGALTRYNFSRDGVPYDRARYRRAQRKLFDYYHATANDSGWTGEDSWLGGQIYETDDASGPTGERVRIGARATGTNGSAVAASIQVDGAVILDARSDQVKCQKALVIPVLASADVPTPAANSFALFFEGGVLKSKNSSGTVANV
ncbi:hypothetical protein [Sphingobium lactosutens]|uniref:Uncharacterized protein n=1 Tax=Sphingobium lactosutens DS20 TaxID=1331060 RepID=T0HLH0_9SPHN|nr:hypothetical protein [Sphingobium lactosutens]EQB13028.1 hypothetical protein RLDS_17055 [Sphingobium lactosutens DS20]